MNSLTSAKRLGIGGNFGSSEHKGLTSVCTRKLGEPYQDQDLSRPTTLALGTA